MASNDDRGRSVWTVLRPSPRCALAFLCAVSMPLLLIGGCGRQSAFIVTKELALRVLASTEHDRAVCGLARGASGVVRDGDQVVAEWVPICGCWTGEELAADGDEVATRRPAEGPREVLVLRGPYDLEPADLMGAPAEAERGSRNELVFRIRPSDMAAAKLKQLTDFHPDEVRFAAIIVDGEVCSSPQIRAQVENSFIIPCRCAGTVLSPGNPE